MGRKIKCLIYVTFALTQLFVSSAFALTVNLSTYDTDQELANLLTPIVYFHPDEDYLPMSIDTFVQHSTLRNSAGAVLLSDPTQSTILATSTASTDYLDLDDTYRTITTSSAISSVPIYAHVVRSGNYIDIQYTILFGYSGCQTFDTKTHNLFRTKSKSSRFIWCNFARHEGDWEHMAVRLNASTGAVESVVLGQHGKDYWYDDSEISWSGYHPKVYVSVSVHSLRPGTTTYVTDTVLGGSWADLVSLVTCSNGWIDRLRTVDTTSTNDFVSGDNSTWVTWSPSVYLFDSDEDWYGYSGRWGDYFTDNSDVGDPEGNIPLVSDSCFTDIANTAIRYGFLSDEYLEGYSPQSPWAKSWFNGDYDD